MKNYYNEMDVQRRGFHRQWILCDNGYLVNHTKHRLNVKKKTKERDSSVLGGEFMHIRCFAHILNLIMPSELKSIHKSKRNNCSSMICQLSGIPLITYYIVRAIERFEEENGHNKLYFCKGDWNWKSLLILLTISVGKI